MIAKRVSLYIKVAQAPETLWTARALRGFGTAVCIALAFCTPLEGCGGRGSSSSAPEDAKLPEACEAFLATYERSLSSLGPADVAHAREVQTRASLAAQLTRAGDDAARDRVKDLCDLQMKTWTTGKTGQ